MPKGTINGTGITFLKRVGHREPTSNTYRLFLTSLAVHSFYIFVFFSYRSINFHVYSHSNLGKIVKKDNVLGFLFKAINRDIDCHMEPYFRTLAFRNSFIEAYFISLLGSSISPLD